MPETNPKNSRRILLSHRVFWLTAAILGFIHAWAGRHEINGDGVPYLDMGDAYLRGDWKMAINATFSPLYSWIVGFGLFVFKPSPYWEFTVVHLVNFVIYLATLASFTFFLLQLIRYWRERAQESSQSYEGLPEIGFLVLGYGLFIYSSLIWISPKIVEPDMCVAAFVYLAAGILARLRRSKTSKLNFVALGVILGFGYLAKTFVFPLAFVILLVALFLTRDRKKAVPKVVLATIVFLLLSTPFVVALSKSKGRLTIGDTGKLNYAWHVNHIESFNWQGDNPGNGIPKHPSRRIFNAPPVYEFATPVGGTYPNWYDPSYWYDGVVSRYT
jgi:4-amino-4-deoxy-L-arabinose transferase-like glycosyltransferase